MFRDKGRNICEWAPVEVWQALSQAGEASGIQGRVENHSAIGPNVVEARQEERREVEEIEVENPLEANPGAPTSNPGFKSSQRARVLKSPGRKKRIKWSKSNEAGEWRRLDEHLSELLQKTLCGPVEAKVNLFSEILNAAAGMARRWRKAEEREKEGLKALWDDIRERLANLRRAERIQRRRKRKEKERANFFRNPFRFARGLLEEKTNGTLEISKEDLEEHICVQYSDPARTNPLGPPGYVPKPPEPSALFDTSKCQAGHHACKISSSTRAKRNTIPVVQELPKSAEAPLEPDKNCLDQADHPI
ncbi:hypothetical protein SKAU_G00066900 [Synaphobranchus kaupii]|uniref:Uncharacterized protein n=1 Tax=Synaphobranchus kaupii TaxID=118154 RepID=A0A9Q1JBB5_SYNKA|nr:hypothetical protein SKAU_G00066900 [Synaphobranchus kaupii]